MRLNITNTGSDDTTVSGIAPASVSLRSGTTRGGPSWSAQLDAGDLLATEDYGDEPVIIVGHKPSVTEQLREAGSVLQDTAAGIGNRDPDAIRQAGSGAPAPLSLIVANLGTNAVRAVLGDGLAEQTIHPGAEVTLDSPGYVELRELGLVNPNLEQQPSSAA